MIHIKDAEIAAAMLRVPFQNEVIEVLSDIDDMGNAIEGLPGVVITSAYRDGDPGTHGTIPCRSLDLRKTKWSELICDSINEEWEYDYKRPTLKCASIHGEHPHIHLKVHANTKRRA